MAVKSKTLPLSDSCLPPLPGFESRPGPVRKFPVTWGWAVVFASYSVFPRQIQIASHDRNMAERVTKNRNSKLLIRNLSHH